MVVVDTWEEIGIDFYCDYGFSFFGGKGRVGFVRLFLEIVFLKMSVSSLDIS